MNYAGLILLLLVPSRLLLVTQSVSEEFGCISSLTLRVTKPSLRLTLERE
ncbi:MAG: hypothetical protein NTY15_21345 [Planctomycetota bacterium]|nr:hypothetical protein [Planctomycetota bacterium]